MSSDRNSLNSTEIWLSHFAWQFCKAPSTCAHASCWNSHRVWKDCFVFSVVLTWPWFLIANSLGLINIRLLFTLNFGWWFSSCAIALLSSSLLFYFSRVLFHRVLSLESGAWVVDRLQLQLFQRLAESCTQVIVTQDGCDWVTWDRTSAEGV